MDKNNWTVQGGEPSMDINNWRDTLQQDSRQRIINKIMDTLKKHLPCSGQDGLLELRKIAVRFEEKIYASATSQPDYLRKISLKMLSMETKSQTTIANSVGNGNRPPDAVTMSNWRDSRLPPDSRQRIINRIVDALKKHVPFSGQDGLHELRRIAVRFEEEIYSAATSQSDYLRKISVNIVSMETKFQTTIADSAGNGKV